MRRHSDLAAALALMLVLLGAFAAIWFPFIPNGSGRVSVDFSFWLPNLLAGYYWYLHNGIASVPWFTPAQCAGVPFNADPQGAWFSLPQFLTFVMPPLAAVKVSALVFAAAGFAGAWFLARRSFALSAGAAAFAAGLFMLNGFFAVRMVVGHISFSPFMLLPALGAVVLRAPGRGVPGLPSSVARVTLGGLIVAAWIEGGMVHILPPCFLSLVIVALLHAAWFGVDRGAFLRLGGVAVLGLALSAGRLAATLSLIAQVPRDAYPLPGVAGLPGVIYVIFRSLFTPVSDAMGQWIVHSRLLQEQHEFEYGVSLAPPLLMLVAGWMAWRGGWRPRFTMLGATIGLLLLVPVALNWYQPAWNAVLKSLPFFGSSSTLMRWCCAYILPVILGGAIALDRIAAGRTVRAWALAAGGIALMVVTLALSDHTKYGADVLGFYNADAIDAAWYRAHATGAVPPVSAVTEFRDQNHQLLMAPERQNALTQGFSQLFCYDPLFGYRLEKFPFGHIQLGDTMFERDGRLNIKNPACYVFPGANQCRPGDQFSSAQAEAAGNFVSYRPFAFAKPLYARAADWLSLLALLAAAGALGWSAWMLARHTMRRPA